MTEKKIWNICVVLIWGDSSNAIINKAIIINS